MTKDPLCLLSHIISGGRRLARSRQVAGGDREREEEGEEGEEGAEAVVVVVREPEEVKEDAEEEEEVRGIEVNQGEHLDLRLDLCSDRQSARTSGYVDTVHIALARAKAEKKGNTHMYILHPSTSSHRSIYLTPSDDAYKDTVPFPA